jgi:hypothetical protein
VEAKTPIKRKTASGRRCDLRPLAKRKKSSAQENNVRPRSMTGGIERYNPKTIPLQKLSKR